MAPDTQTKILEYLRKNKSATAGELSLNLTLTGANIRHHLALMKEAGQIVNLGQRQEGKGRPINIYGASEKVLGTGMSQLAEAMLETWFEKTSEEETEVLLNKFARNLAGKPPTAATANASRRLGQMVERMNELRYQAQWEAGAAGARVILGHCPYAEIIKGHPELCRMDGYLLEAQSGMRARQVSKLERGNDGTKRCIFTME